MTCYKIPSCHDHHSAMQAQALASGAAGQQGADQMEAEAGGG